MKPKWINGAFLRNLSRCFGSWNCLESFESKDAFLRCLKRCLELQNKNISGVFQITQKIEDKTDTWYIRTLFETSFVDIASDIREI